jgi:glutaminyl-tRNA synthetase
MSQANVDPAKLPLPGTPDPVEAEVTGAQAQSLDFIREIVAEHKQQGTYGGNVITRFPPEPNGYLHIGHAKSICLNFGIAQEFGGRCHLRMDDTNPTKEEVEYIESIKNDVRWLGFDWGEHYYHASDYFDQLYDWTLLLIKAGKAYVDDQTPDEIRHNRGTLTEPGKNSPFRDRSPEENLDLFTRMKAGEFPDGSKVLRAKIDMTSPNLNMRDPVMYRILHATHPHAGDKWCVYPMYDWAHGQSDWIEGVTHSICTLEFENHRPLYDWFVESLIEVGAAPAGVAYRPRQYEFARLELTYTLLSKRKLLELVKTGTVRGWDDPRMPTISGYRRKGYTPQAIRNFAREVGVGKFNATIDIGRLENALREDLNKTALRRMAVLRPIKVIIDNYPDGRVEQMDAQNNPEDESAGTRTVPFSRVIYIEQDDFEEVPPPKFFRLTPGKEVRLRSAYWVKCTHVDKDAAGNITAVHCTYDPQTRGGNNPPDGRKVKGTIHWVSADHAVEAEVRLYEHLFATPDPSDVPDGQDWKTNLNPNSETVIKGAKLEPALSDAPVGSSYQFERLGYFCVDPDTRPGAIVFNRSVSLKDSWAKEQKKK